VCEGPSEQRSSAVSCLLAGQTPKSALTMFLAFSSVCFGESVGLRSPRILFDDMHHVVLTFRIVSLLSSLSGTEDTQCGVDIAPSISMLEQQGHSGAILANLLLRFPSLDLPESFAV